MRVVAASALFVALAMSTPGAAETRTYVGVITDTMCGTDHAAMKKTPDARCVRECVADGTTHRYAWTDGKVIYTLSDQETPARFSGQKVRVTGTLYTRTGILKVDRIDPVK